MGQIDEQCARRLSQLRPRKHSAKPWYSGHHLTFSRRWLSAIGLGLVGGTGWAWRRSWRARGLALGGMGLLAAAAWTAARRGTRQLRVERVRFAIQGLRQPLRVVQISDFHFGSAHSRVVTAQALALLDGPPPDLLLLTGDFLDHGSDLPALAGVLDGRLKARLGVFACLGNHDYWSTPAGIAHMLEAQGVTVLLNEHHVLELDGQPLVVAGITDSWYGDADLDAALRGVPAGAPVLLLAHCPDAADAASAAGVALQLSGHTHAGHISLPGLGPLVLPHLGVRYYRGRYEVGSMSLYVNRGLAGLALRLGASPEITEIQLDPA